MKHIFPFLLTALVLVSCGSNNTRKKASATDGRDSYTLETSFRTDDEDQYDAVILECKSGAKSQSFTFEFNWPKDKDFVGEAGAISEDDINADGFPDIVVSLGNFGVMSPLYFYGACVWNEETRQFDLVEEYANIPNAEPCQGGSKNLVKSEGEDMDGFESVDYYYWKDGKLVLMRTDDESEDLLPDEFAWAYGWWKVTQDSGTEFESTYEIIINGSTYQSNEGLIAFGYADEGFYPVYTMPRIPFTVDESGELRELFELGDDDLVLSTGTIGDYEHFIILNGKTHTIGQETVCERVDDIRDQTVIEEYERLLAAIPIEGKWENLKKESGYMAEDVNLIELEQSDNNVLTKKGNIIEWGTGNLISYNKENDRLTVTFSGIEEGNPTYTYKRVN